MFIRYVSFLSSVRSQDGIERPPQTPQLISVVTAGSLCHRRTMHPPIVPEQPNNQVALWSERGSLPDTAFSGTGWSFVHRPSRICQMACFHLRKSYAPPSRFAYSSSMRAECPLSASLTSSILRGCLLLLNQFFCSIKPQRLLSCRLS